MMWMTKRNIRRMYDAMNEHANTLLDTNRETRKQVRALEQDLKLLMEHQGVYIERVREHSVVRTKGGPERGE